MIDVCIITYNHEKFIAQAIEGALSQRSDYEYQVIISDDCSTDKTFEICSQYAAQYPNKIRLIATPYNLGMAGNWAHAIKACTSKFIALCEGDDYWVNDYKLDKQVCFLEANPDYAICFHRVYESEDDKERKLSTLNTSEQEETYTIEDLAKGNLIHTPSIVFRNGSVKDLPSWFSKSPAADYPLLMLNARGGKIKYLPEPMAVYRRHSGGIWSSRDTGYILEKWLIVLDLLATEFEGKVLENLLLQKAKAHNTLGIYYNSKGMSEQSKYHFYNSIKLSPAYFEPFYDEQKALINAIKNSRSFKLGNFILKPLSKLRDLIG